MLHSRVTRFQTSTFFAGVVNTIKRIVIVEEVKKENSNVPFRYQLQDRATTLSAEGMKGKY
jgi:hypothetical protein